VSRTSLDESLHDTARLFSFLGKSSVHLDQRDCVGVVGFCWTCLAGSLVKCVSWDAWHHASGSTTNLGLAVLVYFFIRKLFSFCCLLVSNELWDSKLVKSRINLCSSSSSDLTSVSHSSVSLPTSSWDGAAFLSLIGISTTSSRPLLHDEQCSFMITSPGCCYSREMDCSRLLLSRMLRFKSLALFYWGFLFLEQQTHLALQKILFINDAPRLPNPCSRAYLLLVRYMKFTYSLSEVGKLSLPPRSVWVCSNICLVFCSSLTRIYFLSMAIYAYTSSTDGKSSALVVQGWCLIYSSVSLSLES